MAPTGNLPRVNDTSVEEWGRIITLLREHDTNLGVLDRARMAAGRKRKLTSANEFLVANHCTRVNLTILLQLGVVTSVTLADFAQSMRLPQGVLGRFDRAIDLEVAGDEPLPDAVIVSDVLLAHKNWSDQTITVLKDWIAHNDMWVLYQTGGLSPAVIQQLVDRNLIEGTAEQPFFHTPGKPLLTTDEIALLREAITSRT